MKKLLLISGILILLTTFIPAQNDPYIFGSLGGFSTGSAKNNPYKNSPAVVFSTGFGIPLYGAVSLYSRLSYIYKSNYTGREYQSYINSDLEIMNELVETNASFSQLLVNGGLQYNIHLSKEVNLGISGGITYAMVNHMAALPSGLVIQRLDNTGVFGVFSGVSIEKFFEDTGASVFGEAQYNYAKRNVVYFRDKFSGMNFTIGGKFYLN